MPHEILSRQYIFQPAASTMSDSVNDDTDDAIFAALIPVEEKDSSFTVGEFYLPPIVHNFQHDVESLWWITLYTLTGRVKHLEANKYANAVFQTTLTLNASRHDALLSDDTTFRKRLVSVLPPSLSSLVPWILLLRRRLLYHYQQHALHNNIFVKGSYGPFHTSIQKVFSPRTLEATGSDWHSMELVIHNPYLKLSVPNKSCIPVNSMYPGRKRLQPKSDDEYEDSPQKKSKTSGQRMQTRSSAASASASRNS